MGRTKQKTKLTPKKTKTTQKVRKPRLKEGGYGPREPFDSKHHGLLLYYMALCGHTDAEMAKKLGKSRSTLARWKKENPELAKSMLDAKERIDARVEQALISRCLGFDYEEVTTEEIEIDGLDGEKLPARKKRTTKRRALPDPSSMQFWLTHRQPKRWGSEDEGDGRIDDAWEKALERAVLDLSAEDRKLLREIGQKGTTDGT